jgi:hypothetical protein
MQTALDESTLERVTNIVDEVGQAIGSGTDQDHLLMLTCLQLAYSLEKILGKLEPLESRLENLVPWVPFSDTEDADERILRIEDRQN